MRGLAAFLFVTLVAPTFFALTAAPGFAQPAPVREGTVLSLSETAEREVAPDLLRARLFASATAATATSAQAQVNAMMEKALATVRRLGLSAETMTYNTWEETQRPVPVQPGQPPAPPPQPRWRAQQQLSLVAGDPAKVLQAVGALQADGLGVQQLAYELSRAKRRSLEDELTREALARLKGRAELSAAALGLTFTGWSTIRLGGSVSAPPVQMQRLRAEAASAMPVPQAEAGPQLVVFTVDGEAILK